MIIWIASFPKSGNTWLRSIVSSLIFSEDGIFNFKLNKNIKQFPTTEHLKDFTDDFNNIHEIKKYWLLAQDRINLDNKIKFFKTHHLNCTIDNFSFTNKDNTAATIYIVRDPRNLVNSISNHFSKTTIEAKEFLFRPNILGAEKDIRSKGEVVTLIGSWKDHFNFWTKKNDNLLLLKYENILLNPMKELNRIKNFLSKLIKFRVDEIKDKNIINSTSFNSLKKMEENGDFKENVFEKISNKKIKFFNQGPKNRWQEKLDNKIRLEIETKFKTEMKELDYL